MLGGAGLQPSTVANFVLTWVSAWPVKRKGRQLSRGQVFLTKKQKR